MEFGDKLRQLREQSNLSREDLSTALNITYSALSKYETNIRFPDKETLKNIATYFRVSIDYLLDFDSKPLTKIIPILGTIRAGLPILAQENWEGQIDVPKEIQGDFALRVTGDSMSWVGIYEGDIAVFRNSNVAYNGDIVAAGVQEGDWCATLKFFIKENGIPFLRAANPNYEDICLTSSHRIVGVLVRVLKQPPSIYNYRDFLVNKDLVNTEWHDAVAMAISHGLNGKEMMNMIELFSKMVKQIK